MTIAVESGKTVTYTGDGVIKAFAVTFEFDDAGDLAVVVNDKTITVGNPYSKKVNVTDYAVTGGSGTTGTVTFVTEPAATDEIVIYRDLDNTQSVNYIPFDNFPAETHELALDKLTEMIQQLSERLGGTDFILNSFRLNTDGTAELPRYKDSTRPTPGASQRVEIWNDDDGKVNYWNGTAWTLADGTTT